MQVHSKLESGPLPCLKENVLDPQWNISRLVRTIIITWTDRLAASFDTQGAGDIAITLAFQTAVCLLVILWVVRIDTPFAHLMRTTLALVQTWSQC